MAMLIPHKIQVRCVWILRIKEQYGDEVPAIYVRQCNSSIFHIVNRNCTAQNQLGIFTYWCIYFAQQYICCFNWFYLWRVMCI